MSEAFITKADQAGVYYLPAKRRAALTAVSAATGLRMLQLAIPNGTATRELLARLGDAFQFPDWYGANFDALFDCLTDPDLLPAPGTLLILTGGAGLHKSDQDGFTTLLAVLQAAATELREQGKPLWVLIDCPVQGIVKLPQA